MAHIFEVGLEGHPVNLQSIAFLDHNSSLLGPDPSTCSLGPSFIFEDDGDVFQCGRCKKQFTSLQPFVSHKREGCTLLPSTEESKYNLCLDNTGCLKADGNDDQSCSDEDQNVASGLMNEKPFESLNDSAIPPLSLAEENEHSVVPQPDSTVVNAPASGVIHVSPSIVVGDETYTFTIPVDQNSSLGQFLTANAGSNSSAVISIPEHELVALINATDKSNPSGPTDLNTAVAPTYVVSASLLPSKDPANKTTIDSVDFLGGGTAEFVLDSLNSLRKNNGEKLLTPQLLEATVLVKNNGDSGNFTPRQNSSSTKIHLLDPQHSNLSRKPEMTPDGKRKCEYCGKPFKKLFNLHQHIRSHTGEKPFHCLVCGRGFTQKSNVKKHMQTHKVWPKIKYTLPKEQISVKIKEGNGEIIPEENGSPNDNVEYVVNNVYVCQYCDQHFENYHKLKTHLSHTHKNEKLFKCIHNTCMATFLEVEGLISHMRTHEDQLEYQCQSCPKKFKSLFDLGTHQYSHRLLPNKAPQLPPKQYRCTKCNSKYASAEALNHHLLTSSHNYPCSQCNLTFVCERYLRRHLRIHGTVEPYKCELCGKMFKTENYLKSHLVIHSDSKPFHCEICKQSFNRRDKLTRHKLMHDNRKKYKCPYKSTGCEREFYRKDKLKDHLMSHSRKTYPCTKCNKTFSWPVKLRQHQASQHPEMMASTTCAVCQKIFKTKHHLKIHICKCSDDEAKPSTPLSETHDIATSLCEASSVTNDVLNDSLNSSKMVLYNDCEIEDSMNSCSEHKMTSVMLGGFTPDESESAIFSGYSDDDVKVGSSSLSRNHELDPIEITFGEDDGQIGGLILGK